MAELNYGKDYKYAHDYENHFVKQEFLPKEILNERLWKGQENPSEHKLIDKDNFHVVLLIIINHRLSIVNLFCTLAACFWEISYLNYI